MDHKIKERNQAFTANVLKRLHLSQDSNSASDSESASSEEEIRYKTTENIRPIRTCESKPLEPSREALHMADEISHGDSEFVNISKNTHEKPEKAKSKFMKIEGVLTKNQKRKLKKKRHKEKLKEYGTCISKKDISTTFLCEIEEKKEETVNLTPQAEEVEQFLLAVWNNYMIEAQKKQNLQEFQNKFWSLHKIVEKVKKLILNPEDIKMLHRLKTLIMFSDKQRSLDAITNLENLSSLNEDEITILKDILTYWLKNIVKLSPSI